jgi:hypothetical protein
METPRTFAQLVDRIREVYAEDPSLSLYLSQLADRLDAPSYDLCAAVAALMNSGFLRWDHDGSVVRADAEVTRTTRRTA